MLHKQIWLVPNYFAGFGSEIYRNSGLDLTTEKYRPKDYQSKGLFIQYVVELVVLYMKICIKIEPVTVETDSTVCSITVLCEIYFM